ncbi:MAG: hypothetical protein QM709_00920 [Spongiibacteraceae bacterium]
MTIFNSEKPYASTISAPQTQSTTMLCLFAALIGLAFAWPLLYASLVHGTEIIIRSLTGDSYHYLAIARKANIAHIYTYDGVSVTNGFHPLWQYAIRGLFAAFDLQSHESQAIAVMWMALISATIGIALTAVAVVRMTNQYFLGLLIVPGLFYLTVGVHVRTLSVWSALDGMESAFSLLFGGIFFFLFSRYSHARISTESIETVPLCRALGLVLPFLILSRLDDVFILPAFLLALLTTNEPLRKKITAGLWIVVPSSIAVLCYLIYNLSTVGVAMPLSGGTKAGFVGFLSAYLIAAIHLPPLLDLKSLLTHTPSDGAAIFTNSFRFVEVAYPMIAAVFGAIAIRRYWRHKPQAFVLLALCLYIVFKEGYNFLNVHPWHQASWYFTFINLCLSVLGAVALKGAWIGIKDNTIARRGLFALYVSLLLLSGSQYYSSIVYKSPNDPAVKFWERQAEIRHEISSHGVHGIINFDDGITAFLLDVPNLHGFAFATDVEAQKAHKAGKMLSLAYSRGIDCIAGFEYMSAEQPPQTDADIKNYLRHSLAEEGIRAEMDRFNFSLAYYDPILKMPFFTFQPNDI